MKTKTCSFNNDQVFKYLGRPFVNEDGSITLDVPDAGFAFGFVGDFFNIKIKDYSHGENAYIKIYVDGIAQKHEISSTTKTIVVDGLENKCHQVELLRITIANAPLTISHLVFDDSSTFLPKPEDRPHKIQFIGDSLTEGYGVLGSSESKTYYPQEQDSTMSYAGVLARMLNSDYSFCGMSGRGLVSNCNGDREDMTMKQAFLRTSYHNRIPWDHQKWIPDLICVNAGTNDAWSKVPVEKDEFIEAAKSLLQTIIDTYPNKPIVYIYGYADDRFLPYVKEAVDCFAKNNQNVHLFEARSFLYSENNVEMGGNGHPNTIASKRLANELFPLFDSLLNN